MKVHHGVDVGAATRAGPGKRVNEDDLLILEPEDPERKGGIDRLLVVADGMGGASGGSEASRAAVRALAGVFLSGEPVAGSLRARMQQAFLAACRGVAELAQESRALRGMGTTLTALVQRGERAVVGHVGDSRCWRLRAGVLELLTTDHATEDGTRRLLRCIGAGRESEEVDLIELEVHDGDVLLLATDGLWTVVPATAVSRLLVAGSAQQAAEALVREAAARGGSDDTTAVVLAMRGRGGDGGGVLREVEIPAEESSRRPVLRGSRRSLRRPIWPWVLIVVGVLVLVAVALEQVLARGP